MIILLSFIMLLIETRMISGFTHSSIVPETVLQMRYPDMDNKYRILNSNNKGTRKNRRETILFLEKDDNVEKHYSLMKEETSPESNWRKQEKILQNRRDILFKTIIRPSVATSALVLSSQIGSSAWAVERAVGSAEKSCRDKGNCLELGDWDGAVGWNWGGKERCDATDPRCGADGKLTDDIPRGQPVPQTLGLTMTHMVRILVSIGKTGERGTMTIGLYGNNAPVAVNQMLDFMDPNKGLLTTSKLMLDEGYGVTSSPVSLYSDGTLNVIYPNERLDFGIPSQQIAYGKKMKLSRIPSDFIPQPRPSKNQQELKNERSIRLHDVAGLLSVPARGLGYGGTGFETDDEAYSSAFQITSTAVPSMDKKEDRRVIGQLMDVESMNVLARLSSLPTKKGLKGVIPGQNYGPPLLKVQVLDVSMEPLNKSPVTAD